MSSLYLRPRSPYVWIKYSVNGVTRRRSTGVRVARLDYDDHGNPVFIRDRRGHPQIPREARDFQSQLDARIRLQEAGQFVKKPKAWTLSKAFEEFMASHGSTRKKSTQACYRLAEKKLIRHFDDVKIASITEEQMVVWRNGLVEEGGRFNAARDIRFASVMFKWAEEKGYLWRSPITRRVKVSTPRRPVIVYSEEDQAALFGVIDAPLRDQLLVCRMMGLRSGEAARLRWDDVRLAQRIVVVANEKEDRYDSFPVDDSLLAFFSELPRSYSPFVFRYRSIWTVAHKTRKAIRSLSLDNRLNVHAFRKTFISDLVASGASESELLYLARLRSIHTAHEYYTFFRTGHMRTALARSRTQVAG